MPAPIGYVAAKYQVNNKLRLKDISEATIKRYSFAALAKLCPQLTKSSKRPREAPVKVKPSAAKLAEHAKPLAEASARVESEQKKLPEELVEIEFREPVCLNRVKVEKESAEITIGPNGTTVSHICMSRAASTEKYTKAVSLLLMELFTRDILATHSLTGKESPGMSTSFITI